MEGLATMAAALGMMAMMMLFPVLMLMALAWLFNKLDKMGGE